jgi:ABC-2 type transport system permease protein
LTRQPMTLRMDEVAIGPRRRERTDPTASYVAAIIAMLIIQGGLGAAIALVSERQRGSSDIFRVAPACPTHMVIGNLAARVLVGGLQAIAVIGAGLLAFGVGVKGSWAVLALLVALGTLAFTAIGGALAMLAKNVEAISGIITLVTLPLLFLSGLFFPIDALPPYARSFALALPSSYLGDGLRWAVTGVSSITSLGTSLMVLAAWTLGCLLFSVKFYRWD